MDFHLSNLLNAAELSIAVGKKTREIIKQATEGGQ